jgi:hypothetical protein
MPLDLSLAPSPRSTSAADALSVAPSVAVDETLLFELPTKLGVHVPIWTKLGDAAYDDPELTMREVESLAGEVRLLRERWLADNRELVIRERKIHARDHAMRMALADKVLAERADPTRDLLDRLASLCEAALTAGVGLVGCSD